MALRVGGNGNGNGRHRNGNGNGHWSAGKLALLALAILVVALLAWRQVERLAPPRATVWVASANLLPGSLVGAEDLKPVQLAARDASGAELGDRGEIEGRQLARAKREGEPFTSGDFAPQGNGGERPSLAAMLPEGRVLARVRVLLEDVIMFELRSGDHFEVLASFRDGRSGVVARDATLVGWVNPRLAQANQEDDDSDESWLAELVRMPNMGRGSGIPTQTTMLLALAPEDVVPLLEAQAAGGTLTVVLHGAKEVARGEPLRLTETRGQAIQVEMITGDSRERVQFVR